MKSPHALLSLVAFIVSVLGNVPAVVADEQIYTLTIKKLGTDFRHITIPTGKKFEIVSFIEMGTVNAKSILRLDGITVAETQTVTSTTTRVPFQIVGAALLEFTLANFNAAAGQDSALLT